MNSKFSFTFFGGEPLSVPVLEELKTTGLLPELIVCSPDRPVGRKQVLTPPPTKVWAENNGIEVFQPESFKDKEMLDRLIESPSDVFVVVAYNFILPKWLIALPKHKTVNVHPSLLPKLRGPSPIRTAIAEDKRDEVGVSIMLLDEKMDHGPILNQAPMVIDKTNWPIDGIELDQALARMGGALLADTLPRYIAGEITPTEQDHAEATYTQKHVREDGRLDIDPFNLPTDTEAWKLFLKITAFSGWPETFFEHEGKRVKIKEAELANDGSLRLLRVTPQGKSEMDFSQYLASLQ